MEFRSSRELLDWLVEIGTARGGSGVLKRGEHLLSLATSEGKVPQPPKLFADWLYELRDRGAIVFDDSDAPGTDIHLVRDIAVTAAGQATVKTA